MSYPLLDSQLPTYPTLSVNLHRETLERFRDDYHALGEFAALVCGVDVRTLSRLHLEQWLWVNRGIVSEFTAAARALDEHRESP